MTSTDLVPFESYAIAGQDPRELLAAVQANLGGQKLTERDLDTIKMPSGGSMFFEVPDLEEARAEKTLTGVLVHHKLVRAYWRSGIDEGGGGTPPDCHSPGGDADDVMWGFGSPGDERRADGLGCEGCPMAEFGTATKDGKAARGQACGAYHLLFLAGAEDLLPVVVRMSPASLEPTKKFLLRLASKAVPYYSVVVEIGLKPAKSADGVDYAQATLRVAKRLGPDDAAKVKAIGDVFGPLFDRMAAAQAQAGRASDGHDVDADALADDDVAGDEPAAA